MGILAGRGFGLLIAYVVPGFVALVGIGTVSPAVANWLFGAGTNGPTAGGVVYLVIASVGAGMTAGAFRWLLIDRLLSWHGVVRPKWDDSDLWRRQQAYELLIEIHYRYYHFYGNTTVALVFAWTLAVWASVISPWTVVGVVAISSVFVAAGRDALSNYYARVNALLVTQDWSSTHDQRRTSRRRIKTGKRQEKYRPSGQAQHEHSRRAEESGDEVKVK